jgi:hypothetical protein
MRAVWLAEAALHLLAAKGAVAVLPFSRIVALVFRPSGTSGRRRAARRIAGVRWAVRKTAEWPLTRSVCLPQALAAHWMLCRRGIPSVVCFGIGRDAGSRLTSHAWLRVGEWIVIGGEAASAYVPVQEYPSDTKGAVL